MNAPGSCSIVTTTVRASRIPPSAVILFAVVLGCGGGTGGATGIAGSGSGGSAETGAAGTTGAGGTSAGSGSGGSAETGAAGTTGAGGTSGTTGAGGMGVCAVACTTGRNCCGGGCVNLQNDPFNCGVCGRRCEGGTPYCGDGTCQQSPCNSQTELCAPNSICCGNICCPVGDICCQDQGPISVAPNCHTPTMAAPTCPQGCAPLCKSDRNQKKNIAPADTDAILRKVGELPISTWTYLNEPSTVRHLGPMAQDFHASFGLGDDDRSYHSIDAHGVALAAIQALERVVSQQEQRIEKLERENRVLGRRLQALDSPHQLTSKERRK